MPCQHQYDTNELVPSRVREGRAQPGEGYEILLLAPVLQGERPSRSTAINRQKQFPSSANSSGG